MEDHQYQHGVWVEIRKEILILHLHGVQESRHWGGPSLQRGRSRSLEHLGVSFAGTR
jgi:hypothetical protein